ncbi:MAG TPA: MBL fold metallo-hydrolase [Syntrophales bacterium]|nr:MBL fold metallo-hydrolase [Syntrophales bacterium]
MVEKITENFYMITLPMPFRLGHVHVFALIHNGKVALFDTGVNTPEAFTKLEGSLKAINKNIRDIDRIYITHFHTDHCGIAGQIKGITGASIFMSELDAQHIHTDQDKGIDINRLKMFYRQQGLAEKFINSLIELLDFFKKATIPFRVDMRLADHEFQNVGDKEFEVLSVPGHTRGQICFYFRKEKILLSGDHILPHITPNLSPDPYNPGFRPLKSFLDSLQKVKELPVIKVYPAHGEPFTNLRARVEEISEHHAERKALVLASVKGRPKTTYQVSLDIFGGNLPEFDQFLAVNEAYAHLIELNKEGLIKQEQNEEHFVYTAN